MTSLVRPALRLLLIFTLLTGVLYPAAITGLSQLCFASEANGSLIHRDGVVVGSALIGQPFDDPGLFWGRPSATSARPYDASASSGSNLGPMNPALQEAVASRVAALRAADPGNDRPVPIDLVTASGSGLDPHVSPAAARYQIPRVARARGIPAAELRALVDAHVEGRTFGVLGEPVVNVLLLNRALLALSAR